MTKQELHQVVLEYLKNHVQNQYIYKQIQTALERASNAIDKAIEIYYDMGNSEWGGFGSLEMPDVECRLTNRSEGNIKVWDVGNNDWDNPDVTLSNEDVFRLVRDGKLDFQQSLF